MRNIIIDTGCIPTDIIPMAILNACDDFKISAVTYTTGLWNPEIISNNMFRAYRFLNKDYVLAKGADCPLLGKAELLGIYREVPEDILDFLPLPNHIRFSDNYAWDVIYQTAVQCGGSLEVIFMGPSTNLAIALLKYPELQDLLKKVYLLGGTSHGGDCTAYADLNFYTDPFSARLILESSLPVTLIPSDTCMRGCETEDPVFHLSQEQLRVFRQIAEGCGTAAMQFSKLMICKILMTRCIIFEDACNYEYMPVIVETDSNMAYGRMLLDRRFITGRPFSTRVVTGIDNIVSQKNYVK